MQTARDWYCAVTCDIGMHKDLVLYWIRTAALLVAPIAPHFTEHIWSSTLCNRTSIQLVRWPTPSKAVNPVVIEEIVYLRSMVKVIQDTRSELFDKMGNNTRLALHIYISTAFPKSQDSYVEVTKNSYITQESKMDDVKLQGLLKEQTLIMDEQVRTYVQKFKVITLLTVLWSF